MAEQKEKQGREVAPYSPWRMLDDLRQEMNRHWAWNYEPFRTLSLLRPRAALQEALWPAIDVFDRNGSVVIRADVPGMASKDIEIDLSEDSIRISGERTEEKEVDEKDYHRSERSYGRFYRQVPLPAGVEREKATAKLKDGVLEIEFPAKEAAKPKKIEIKSA